MAKRIKTSEWCLPADLKVMERLYHIGSLFVGNGDLNKIMTEIVEAALFITGTDMGTLQIYDSQSDHLKIIAHRGFEKPWIDFWENFKTEYGACGNAIKTGGRIIVEDVTQSNIFAGTTALDIQLAAGVRAIQSTPLVGRSGRPLGMISTYFRKPHRSNKQTLRQIDMLVRHATDIIERALGECELKESEARFRALVEASSEVLYRMSPDWSEMRQLHSRGFLSNTQKPSRTWLEEYIHPDDQSHVTAAIAEAIRTKGVFQLEHRVRKKDGTLGWTFSRAIPLTDKNGDIVEWFGSANDVTERKQAEESLRQANQTLEKRVAERTADLEQRANQLQQLALDLSQTEDRERKMLAAVLHDDFQQDAAYIKMELTRLANLPDADMQQRLKQLGQFTSTCIEKMRHLSYALNPPALQRSGLLAALIVLAQDMQTHHGLTVTLHTQLGTEPVSSVLASMLYRSIRELLFNVVKHAGVNTVDVEVRRQGKSIRIRVTDKGKGFDYPAMRSSQGCETGFGLYNIEDRMRFLGGSMKVTTRPGKGCSVILTVPIEIEDTSAAPVGTTETADRMESSEPEKPRIVKRSGDHKPIRILLVEDHKLMRKGVAELLQGRNDIAVVGEATNGLEAVRLAEQLRPHVILMDVTMPKMDGIEATARITCNHPHIRIIGLSIHNDDDTCQKMLNAGAIAFLAKTESPNKLLKTIRRVHRDSRNKMHI